MEIVRTAAAVRGRLLMVYGNRGGNTLYATWVALSTLGEKHVQGQMTATTFYRHRSQLVEAGCSWRATDIQLIDSAPRFGDFAPTLVDRRRQTEVHPRVLQLCKRVA
jgi:hypothetical protein